MTNIYGNPGKGKLRRRLFEVGVQALAKSGWKVEPARGTGKSSVRRIMKGEENKLVTIRTTQDTWIAFPRDAKDRKWGTLSDVDDVVAVSVDNPENPRFAHVHMIDGDEMRDRFDRAYKARKAAGRKMQLGRGVWVSLYEREAQSPVYHVGAGAGLDHPPIARVPLFDLDDGVPDDDADPAPSSDQPLTIAEAKRRLALSFGVDPASVKITIEA